MNINYVMLEGHVISEVQYGETSRHNDYAASFLLCIDNTLPVWNKIRVNAFGELARYCQTKKLTRGCKVALIGEVMTRLTNKICCNEIRMFRVLNVSHGEFQPVSIHSTVREGVEASLEACEAGCAPLADALSSKPLLD